MTIQITLSDTTETAAAALNTARDAARVAGDTDELARLNTLGAELETLRHKLADSTAQAAGAAAAALRIGAAIKGKTGDGETGEDRTTDDTTTGEEETKVPTGLLAWGAVARRKHGQAFLDKVVSLGAIAGQPIGVATQARNLGHDEILEITGFERHNGAGAEIRYAAPCPEGTAVRIGNS